MNPQAILQTLNRHQVAYLVLGGFNFLVAHQPILTFDIDVWIEDAPENRIRTARALTALGAAWGPTEEQWKPTAEDPAWLLNQTIFCLTSREGAIDVFREVRGLEGRWQECRDEAIPRLIDEGTHFLGLSDRHMLECQLALALPDQKQDRIATLNAALREKSRRENDS